MPDTGLVTFDPYVAEGWNPYSNRGYYVHQGTVYVCGGITTYSEEPGQSVQVGSATILTGLPTEIRPPEPTTVQVQVDMDDSGVGYSTSLPHFLSSTVYPDGSWTFDGGNPYNDIDFRYYLLYLVLGYARWPTAEATTDDYAPVSLAPYLTPGWTGAPTGAIHGSRFHLGGTLIAGERAFAWDPLAGLPASMVPAPMLAHTDAWTETPSADGLWRLGFNAGSFDMWSNKQGDPRIATGDRIDLTGAGWPLRPPSPPPPPPPPPGPGPGGVTIPTIVKGGPFGSGLLRAGM